MILYLEIRCGHSDTGFRDFRHDGRNVGDASDLCNHVPAYEIVLRNLREAISYVSEHEAEFIQNAAESDMRDRDAEFVRKRETLAKADTRIAELDRIISRLYEDNVIGKLSDERFIKMSHDYELEQSNLKSMADVLRKDLKQQEQQKTNVKAFIAAVKKYTDLQELDAAVLRAFIDRIEVSHVDKKSRTREITIVYNFIGAFDFTRAIENARNTSKKRAKNGIAVKLYRSLLQCFPRVYLKSQKWRSIQEKDTNK